METVQNGFKNALAIIIGVNQYDWTSLQMLLIGKSLRMLHCDNLHEAISMITVYHKKLQAATGRQALQIKYFHKQHSQLCSASTARAVVMDTFSKLQLDPEDAELIIDGMGSIGNVISASENSMGQNTPANISAVKNVVCFFSATTPKLDDLK